MKTKLSNKLGSEASKGVVTSYYGFAHTWYLVLDNLRTYSFEPENQEEEKRIETFIQQLLIGGYVYIYVTYSGQILKVFDMMSQKFLEVEESDFDSAKIELFVGKLILRVREPMCKGYNAYTLKVTNEIETREYKMLVNCLEQKELVEKMSEVQSGYAVGVITTPKGEVTRIEYQAKSLDIAP